MVKFRSHFSFYHIVILISFYLKLNPHFRLPSVIYLIQGDSQINVYLNQGPRKCGKRKSHEYMTKTLSQARLARTGVEKFADKFSYLNFTQLDCWNRIFFFGIIIILINSSSKTHMINKRNISVKAHFWNRPTRVKLEFLLYRCKVILIVNLLTKAQ